jgi:hypothetical protein
MNKYGLPLKTPIIQTILPAMNDHGIMYGWYPISATTFTGAETTFTLPDSGNGGAGTVVPLKSVTTDSGNGVPQYMGAVWPTGLAFNYMPWASSLLQPADEGEYRYYNMPAETWVLNFGHGPLLTGLSGKMNITVGVSTTPGAPTVTTPEALSWQASLAYQTLLGDCEFFDFNWVTLFQASSGTAQALRIVVTSNPAPISPATVPPLVASVIGIPILTQNGVLYDSIRIMKLMDVSPGSYQFTFNIYDILGQVTVVTLNLTIE